MGKTAITVFRETCLDDYGYWRIGLVNIVLALFTSESAPSFTIMIKFLDRNNESLFKDYEVKPIVIAGRIGKVHFHTLDPWIRLDPNTHSSETDGHVETRPANNLNIS